MKKFVVALVLCCGFLLGYGAMAKAFPAGGMYGRGSNRGYFTGVLDTAGDRVWQGIYSGEAIPSYVDTAQELIDFVYSKLGGGGQDRVGASFIIQTMIGGNSRNDPPTAAEKAEWEARVRYAESKGRITWRTNYTYSMNTYYQGCCGGGGNPYDDAFYDNSGTFPAIIFWNASGGVAYAIKWYCANPVGQLGPIPDDLNWTMTGRSTVSNASPRPGDVITFNHFVKNTGTTTTGQDIWSATLSDPSNAVITPGHNGGWYNPAEEKLVDTQTVTVPLSATNGTQICQKVLYDNAAYNFPGPKIGPPVCATVVADFDLKPSIEVQVNGVTSSTNIAEPGDSVSFVYKVNNIDDSDSGSTACTIYGLSRTGYYAVPSPLDSASDVGYVPPATGCPRNFPAHTLTTLGSPESVAAASVTANKSICRSLFVNPATPGGGALGEEKCVYVRNKPYARVYGGDVAVGGGFATAPNVCTANNGGAIIGWNKRGAPNNYGGAGVGYAAYALSAIFDTASSLGGGAAAPTGLSFGNTSTDVTNGNFGGALGSAPCIPDYYGRRPATTSALPATISAMTTGIYGGSGNTLLSGGGVVNPGQRFAIYIDGDVYINNNIAYSGTWTSSNMPNFQLIVRGDIYVDQSISQLDGLYVAQPRTNGTGGIIYTCASTASMYTPLSLSGTLSTQCNTKLTINGAFVARQLQLLRTNGTLKQGDASEGPGSANIAEVFNYNPMLWIAQPVASGSNAEYDAINSLPPVL